MDSILAKVTALILILVVAIAVFTAAKPICLRFMTEADFERRRNVWVALTVTAFISPSFWLYVLVAGPLVFWAARKDTNPVALYVLVFLVIPPNLSLEIPVFGINALFRLDNLRLLAFAILIPAAWRLMRTPANIEARRLTLMDVSILAYGALVVGLMLPLESVTHNMRRGFLFLIDYLVLYYVVSRTCTSRPAIVDTMASFCLTCAILSPLALVETLRATLLYPFIMEQWTNAHLAYQTRSGVLRAMVSAGQALSLGNLLAIGFGFWLYLRSRIQSAPLTMVVVIWLWAGLFATSSRGPAVAAVALSFAYLALGPNGAGRFITASIISAVAAGLVLVSPIGEQVIDRLPFVGTIGAENVAYRQQLLATAWEQIKANPLFGNPLVLMELESMRQGEGIIDLLNTYANIAMFYGCPALFLYVGFLFLGMRNAYRLARVSAVADPELSLLAASLVACLLALLLMMGMGGMGPGMERLLYVVIGLAAGCARLGQLKEPGQARRLQRHMPVSRWMPKHS
jgi:hypothetical protein